MEKLLHVYGRSAMTTFIHMQMQFNDPTQFTSHIRTCGPMQWDLFVIIFADVMSTKPVSSIARLVTMYTWSETTLSVHASLETQTN